MSEMGDDLVVDVDGLDIRFALCDVRRGEGVWGMYRPTGGRA